MARRKTKALPGGRRQHGRRQRGKGRSLLAWPDEGLRLYRQGDANMGAGSARKGGACWRGPTEDKGFAGRATPTWAGARRDSGVIGKPPVPLQTEANENEEPLARIPRSLFSAFQSGRHRCWQGYFISAIRFLHSSGSFSDHGSRSSRKSRFVSSMCFGISVSRCEM